MRSGLFFVILLISFSLISCNPKRPAIPFDVTMPEVISVERPVDSLLTKETKALWINLRKIRGKGILFGQQDANLSGINWKLTPDSSDIKTLTGTYPAVYGYELAGIGNSVNMDSIPFALIKQRMTEAFDRGGINTVTWHMNNPVTGGNAWDVTPAVGQILPDSSLEGFYKGELRKLGEFFKELKNKEGVLVPVIFRPFHESNGNWFWWGKGRCNPEEYKQLWVFTVQFLRDSLQVHNILYAYSTDIFENEDQYMERYPGDFWVDILGCENYWDFQWGSSVSNGISQLRMLVGMAEKHKKLAALTECGFNGIPVNNWWTQFLLQSVKEDTVARNISYMMVWRNANLKQYYTPFRGQRSALDFIAFEKDSFTLFEKDLPKLYNNE
jgi:mannan endo-1,4-beta-mannosidase